MPDRRLPRILVPLLWYLAITLGLPLLNGADRRAGFREHAAITLVLAGVMTAAWGLARRLPRWMRAVRRPPRRGAPDSLAVR